MKTIVVIAPGLADRIMGKTFEYVGDQDIGVDSGLLQVASVYDGATSLLAVFKVSDGAVDVAVTFITKRYVERFPVGTITIRVSDSFDEED